MVYMRREKSETLIVEVTGYCFDRGGHGLLGLGELGFKISMIGNEHCILGSSPESVADESASRVIVVN